METKWEEYQPTINELITLRQASEISGLTTSHLRRLLGIQKIWGIKIDSIWITTEYAIQTILRHILRDKNMVKTKRHNPI